MSQSGNKMSPFTEKLDEIVAKAMEELHGPGLALAVIDQDDVWTKGYGVSNVETGEKVTAKTMFTAGSTSKAFTAAATSILVDENPSITWDTPMHQLIPDDFVLEDDYATTHITIADCLSHRTGFPGHRADLGGTSLKEDVRKMRHLSAGKFSHRSKWEYSNHMYFAVSHMIEEVTGKTLGSYLKEKVFDPLSMNDTFFSIQDALAHEKESSDPEIRLAKHHVWDTEAKAFKVLDFWDDRGLSGAGAIVSNIEDYAKWIKALIKQEDKLPLSAAGYQAISSPHMVSPPVNPRLTGPLCYSYGWWVGVYRGEKILFHPGGVIGAVANMIYFPDRKFGVAAMCCSTADRVMDAALWHLIDDFLGTPEDKRPDVVEDTKKMLEMLAAHAKGALGRLYPEVPSPKIQPALPLEDYLGSYSHPAYGSMIIQEKRGEATLKGTFPGRFTLDPLMFEHVTGEHFFVTADLIPGVMTMETRARFEIDSRGMPKRLGVELDDSNPDLIVWFVQDEKKEIAPEPKEDGERAESEKAAVVVPIIE